MAQPMNGAGARPGAMSLLHTFMLFFVTGRLTASSHCCGCSRVFFCKSTCDCINGSRKQCTQVDTICSDICWVVGDLSLA